MQRFLNSRFAFAAVALALVALNGCGPATDDKTKPVTVPGGPPDDGGHVGPHKGHIIELGRDHQYHGELVHDDATSSVSVYILDKAMKESPIEQKMVTITITMDGKPTTYDLAAVEPKDGKSAHFKGDKKAFEAIEALEKSPKAKARLSLTIAGKSYSGDIELGEHAGHKR